MCYHSRRPLFPPPLIILSHGWRLLIYAFSHLCQVEWFYTKYVDQKYQARFSTVACRLASLADFRSLADSLEISVNAMQTKQIEEIEDALGHEVYFFSRKNERTLNDDAEQV